MEEGKVGRFLFTPFSIFRYERLGAQWMHKSLLDLPIQQERLGPRLTCKFFLGSCLYFQLLPQTGLSTLTVCPKLCSVYS